MEIAEKYKNLIGTGVNNIIKNSKTYKNIMVQSYYTNLSTNRRLRITLTSIEDVAFSIRMVLGKKPRLKRSVIHAFCVTDVDILHPYISPGDRLSYCNCC